MTDDDDLLQTLGALERERDDVLAEWDGFARGERPRDEVVASRVDAGESVEDVEHIAALVSPQRGERRDWRAIAAAALEAQPDQAAKEDPSTPVSLERRSASRQWWVAGAVLVAAAVGVLWIARPRSVQPDLPAYTLIVRNETVRLERGEPGDGPARYRAQSDVSWVLQPRESVVGGVKVVIVAKHRGDTRVIVPPESAVQVNEHGVVQLRGSFGAILPLPPGTWEVRLLVGRDLPSSAEELEAEGPWQSTPPASLEVLP